LETLSEKLSIKKKKEEEEEKKPISQIDNND
jgi:hypothetical protein